METVTELSFLETEDTTSKNPPRTYSSMKSLKETPTPSKEPESELPNIDTPNTKEEEPNKTPKFVKKVTNSPKKEKYPCPLCPKEFQNKSGRYNHIKIHHKVKLDFGKVHCLEAGCLFSCMYTTVLQQHLTTVHNIPMKYLNLEFDNYEDFEKWKHHFETGEVCRFVKKSGARVGEAGKSMYLYCSRSGTFVSQGKGTRLKKIGSSKISAHCTALIKYFEESSGRVKATVCATHYGHDKDHRFLRLTKLQKRHIAEKMKSGMSRELVLDSIRSTFVNKLDRIHELSKKDLNNIQKSYNIPIVNERKKQTNSSSVFYPMDLIKDDWTSDIDKNEESPILFYKNNNTEHETLQNKDKCLILMTKGQKDLFLKFCNNGVAYVTTFRLSTMIGLHLTVIFILDDFYEMFPVCFMISTDTKSEMMKLCFNQLFNVVGPISIRALATDNDSNVLENWHEVMGPHCSHIVANRHVDTEWRKSLTMVENEVFQGDIYDRLYEFIENAEGTEQRMYSLIEELRASVNTAQFATYLEKNYLPNITLWSTYYLKRELSLREPVDYETSYSKISNVSEISCKYNKTVSTTAKGLIKLLIDCQSHRNRKVAENVVQISNAHNASANSSIESVFPYENGKWKVLVNEYEEKKVFEVSTACCSFDDCVLMCDKCESCVHSFYCVCDSYVDGKTCIHVHLVGSMLKKLKSDADAEELNIVLSSYDEMNKNLITETEQNNEMHSFKSESLTVLEEIGRKVMKEKDEKSMQQLLTAIKDFRANIDVLSNYGSHAKNMTFVKSSKLVTKTKKKPPKPQIKNIKKKVITKRKTRSSKN
ncbi:uncharacterized protein LOC135849731 [Planococcus citri]|uniref:uncharacterized protein LOC135849731 n=1 Tax=Planococcus citri TaxID=170843 RepID=UPI0031F8FAA1